MDGCVQGRGGAGRGGDVVMTEKYSRLPGYGAAIRPLGCPETFHFAGSDHELPAPAAMPSEQFNQH